MRFLRNVLVFFISIFLFKQIFHFPHHTGKVYLVNVFAMFLKCLCFIKKKKADADSKRFCIGSKENNNPMVYIQLLFSNRFRDRRSK